MDLSHTCPTIFLLLGYPGTGKLTIARDLVQQLETANREVRLLDNHAAVQVLFSLTPAGDGRSALPPKLFDRLRDVNHTVPRAIEELSPAHWSFVFTHHLRPTDASERYVTALRDLAGRRGVRFLPVVLACEEQELLRRVVHPDRHGRKLIDPDRARATIAEGMLTPPDSVWLDVTRLTARDAAASILRSRRRSG